MRRVTRLGSVEFQLNSMFVEEEFVSGSDQTTETYMSAAGHRITYVRKMLTPYVTLVSREHSWLTEAQCDELLSAWSNVADEHILEYDNGDTVIVTFAYDKKMEFTPTHEGSNRYLAIIPLLKLD